MSLARFDSVACSGRSLALAHTMKLLYLRHYHISHLNIPCLFRVAFLASLHCDIHSFDQYLHLL